MPISKDTLRNGYAAKLEGDMEENRKKIHEIKDGLSDKIYMDSIKSKLITLSKTYHDEWKKSWRSWEIFKSHTRETHINALFNEVNELSVNNLISFLKYIDKEIKYAINENGHNYAATLKRIRTELTGGFDEDVRSKLHDIVSLEDEIQRLVLKQHGEEKTFHPSGKLEL